MYIETTNENLIDKILSYNLVNLAQVEKDVKTRLISAPNRKYWGLLAPIKKFPHESIDLLLLMWCFRWRYFWITAKSLMIKNWWCLWQHRSACLLPLIQFCLFRGQTGIKYLQSFFWMSWSFRWKRAALAKSYRYKITMTLMFLLLIILIHN